MKKKLLVASAALAVSLISALDLHAQGTIVFQNATGYPNYPVLTNSASGPGLAVGSDYHVALYWGPLGSAETDLVQIGSAIQGLPSVPGYFFASPTYTTPAATAPGDDAMFEVKGWTGNYSTYEDAVASGDPDVLVGVSGMWQNSTGGAGSPPSVPSDFTFGTSGFNGLLLDTP